MRGIRLAGVFTSLVDTLMGLAGEDSGAVYQVAIVVIIQAQFHLSVAEVLPATAQSKVDGDQGLSSFE